MNPQPSTTAEPPVVDGNASAPLLDEAAQTLRSLYGSDLNALVVERLVVGIHFVGVKLSNGRAGVAYTPTEIARGAGHRVSRGNAPKGGVPLVRGMPAATVMAGHIAHPSSAVIRLAALNALSVPHFESGRYAIDASGDVSGVPAMFDGRRVCMVGAIMPLIRRLKTLSAREVSIIDYRSEIRADVEATGATFVSPERTAETLARCDTAIFTGAAVANGTVENLIACVPAQSAFAIVGPTAGFVPDPLFRRRAALVGTVIVTDADHTLDVLAEGGGGDRLFGTCVRKINVLNTERLDALGLGDRLPQAA